MHELAILGVEFEHYDSLTDACNDVILSIKGKGVHRCVIFVDASVLHTNNFPVLILGLE
jgi:hypothetical protein